MRGLLTLGFEAFVSWDVQEAIEPAPIMGWGGNAVQTYVLLPADGSLTARGSTGGSRESQRNACRTIQVPAHRLETRPVSTVAAMALQKQFQGYWGTGVWIDVLAALRFSAAAILHSHA